MNRMLRIVCAGVVAAGLLAGSGCGRPRESVTLAGSTAFQPFAEKLADQYMAVHPEAAITVQGGGSALGIQAALSGAAQIGMADLVKLPPEAAALTSIIAARDGIALIVNPSNTVAALTTDQIRGIFNGVVKNWKELGGEDGPITVVSRESGSGTRSSFEQIVRDVRLANSAVIQDSNGTIRETVAQDPRAIGYLSHGLVNEKIKALPVDGVACAEDAIVAGRYPLVRPVFLLTKGTPSATCQAFLNYVLSAEGQELIHKNGLLKAK